MDAMIQLIHVSKWYDRRPALSDVMIEIEKGEFVLLMGPSGSGKSTILRMLIGEEQPDEGQLFVQGKNVTKLKRSEIPYLRRKVPHLARGGPCHDVRKGYCTSCLLGHLADRGRLGHDQRDAQG